MLLLSATPPGITDTMPSATANSPDDLLAVYPFSKARRAGDFVYVSGQIGVKLDGHLAVGFDTQVKQAMDNMVTVLKEQNLTVDDVVKCTIMISDMSKYSNFNTIYQSYFTVGHYPARSAFGANGLASGAQVEIDCIAFAPLNAKP